MSIKVSLTLPLTGSISKPLNDYITTLKEENPNKEDLSNKLNIILRTAIIISKRGFIGILLLSFLYYILTNIIAR